MSVLSRIPAAVKILIAAAFGAGMLALLPGGVLFAIALLLAATIVIGGAWAFRAFFGRRAMISEPSQPRTLADDEHPEAIREVMQVDSASEADGVQVFRGQLRSSAAPAYDFLKCAFSGAKVPLIQEDPRAGAAIVLLPPRHAATVSRPARIWVHWLLFFLTFVTTTFAGALHAGVDIAQRPEYFFVGLPYSLALLAILGCHELGHYYTARARGMNVSAPYFIPVPFALGTFGAFIHMRSPAENRRALFDVAVAGPLAGLIVAVPALLLGLQSSEIVPRSFGTGAIDSFSAALMATPVGSSALFSFLARISLGPSIGPSDTLVLSPLAFAGWLGLLVTALNLLPIGQLDGGHMVHAMFGRRIGELISNASLFLLFALAVLVWHGLLLWAIIVYFIAGRSSFPLNDITPISPGRRWLGFATFALLAAMLLPA